VDDFTLEKIISIIIPTHNSKATIERCIKSLIKQSYPREKFEIIVVDDGSIDGTIELLKTAGVDRIIQTEPCFQGKARNIGAKEAKGELLAFIDSDCVAEKDWTKKIIAELQTVPAASGPILNGNPQSRVAWSEYFIEFGGWDENKERTLVRFFPACNGACTKKVFEQTGGFVESEASEDILFGESLQKEGLKLYFVPQIMVRHLCRTDLNHVKKNMEKLGKFFVKTRKREPTLPYSWLTQGRFFMPLIFFGKVFSSTNHAIKAKKFGKFIIVLPLVFVGISAFCSGVWKEMS